MTLCLWPVHSHADGEKVTFVEFSRGWPPFEMDAHGRPGGAAVDMLKAVMPSDIIIDEMISPTPRKYLRIEDEGVYTRLEAKEWGDTLNMCLWTTPVLEVSTRLYSLKKRPFEFTVLDGLTGKTIGCIKHYYYPTVQPFFDTGRATRYDTNSVSLLLRMLKAGRVDCVIIDEAEAEWLIRTLPEFNASDFHAASTPIEVAKLRFAFSNTPGWSERMPEINANIERARKEGVIDRIMENYR